MRRIYLDACCLNRPFDDQRQDRVRLEAEAVLIVLGRVERGDLQWVGSEALDFEIRQAPDPERRRRVELLTRVVDHRVQLEEETVARGAELQALGFGAYDALHIACAEAGAPRSFSRQTTSCSGARSGMAPNCACVWRIHSAGWRR